jgi:hypothetical protein
MTLSAIWSLLSEAKDEISLGFLILIILASLVQVSKININPWDWFFGAIGKKLNKEVFDKVKDIEGKLDKHIEGDEKEKLEAKRRDILGFANSCMNGRKHTQEQFKFVMKECDEYEKFIEDNHVKNGEITSAIEEIRRLYSKCLQQNLFLNPGEEYY